MLCQFSVRNYKSIRDEMTFDMQALAISEHKKRIIKYSDGQSFLPIAVIYGPNGAGKSNVLEALQALRSKVVRPIYVAKQNGIISLNKNSIIPFLFSKNTQASSTDFELFFRTDLAEYRYILQVKGENVIYESLDRIKFETGRKSELFTRENGNITLKGVFSKLRISDELSEQLPLLSYLGITYTKNDIINDVITWFNKKIAFLNYGNPIEELTTVVSNSDNLKKMMLDMIKEMSLDIEDFRIEHINDNHIEIYTKHIVNGYTNEINLNDESSGTKKLFGLLPFIAKSLVEGNTLVVDELDAKLHPLLLKHIISLFNDITINKKGAQLIFTSHDLSTMNNELFRRDEIWFVAKGIEQNSKLYSLIEFKLPNGEAVRKDARYDKQYLEGKYGADPYLRRLIDWSVIDNV